MGFLELIDYEQKFCFALRRKKEDISDKRRHFRQPPPCLRVQSSVVQLKKFEHVWGSGLCRVGTSPSQQTDKHIQLKTLPLTLATPFIGGN